MKKYFLGCLIFLVIGMFLSSCQSIPGVGNNGDGGNEQSHIHKFEEWSVLVNATCTENGEKVRYCSCGERQTEYIPSGHTVVIDTAVEATCTETGLTEGKHCSECGETFIAQTVVDAKGHTEAIDNAVEPTCTETGLTQGKHCSECGETFIAQTVVDAKGHTEVIDDAVEPVDCSTTGLTEGKHCSKCGYIILPQTIVYVEHSFENRVCLICGEKDYSDGLKFTFIVNGTCYVSGIGTCTDAYIVIPPTSPSGLKVTGIGDRAFYDCDGVTSVTIPDSVTSIGDWAFYNCDGVTSVTIPDSVTSIGDYAFSYCDSLASITVDENNTNYESIDGNLYTKGGKTLVQYAIGKVDTSFVIPNTVTSIGDDAFWNCTSLTSVTIPNSVTSIGDYAFSYCDSLASITVDENNPNYESIDGNLYTKGGKTLVQYAIGKADTSFVVPNSVTSIGERAFYWCDSLMRVEIPDSVTSIGERAFYWCDSLMSVTIPNSVTSIGEEVFYWCHDLMGVEIPDSVTSIGKSAFYGCDSLASVTIPDSVTIIGEKAFYNCDSLTDVYYTGTEEEWLAITIGSYNGRLTIANITYNYVP